MQNPQQQQKNPQQILANEIEQLIKDYTPWSCGICQHIKMSWYNALH
jgi:hypothetical protein